MRCSSRPSRTTADRAEGLRAWPRSLLRSLWPGRGRRPLWPRASRKPALGHTAPPAPTPGDVNVRYVGRRDRDQPRQQFPRAARKSGDQRFRQRASQQPGRRRCLRNDRLRRAFATWGEAYGISSPTAAQGDFVADHRQTLGGVADFGATVAPGVNIGFSVDQSHTVDRRSARAAVRRARSHPARLQRLGRQGSVDMGSRAGSRLRQDQFEPGYRVRHGAGRLRRGRSTAR